MLERIEQIQGVGLFHDAVGGKKFKLQKATLIYADNGRGKSTLANILQSVATGEKEHIVDRKTVDGNNLPKVTFQFASGHKVNFNNGKWSEKRPEFLVFDANFIEKNVHSGGSVSTGQRKNLLEFALGEQAVSAKENVDKASATEKEAFGKVNEISQQLSGYHSGMSLSEFEKMLKVEDADAKIEAIQKRIVEARNVSAIINKPLPICISEPKLDIDALFNLLQKTLNDIHEDTEKVVREHVGVLQHREAESWLSKGVSLGISENCPYCGQSLKGIELIRAYRTYFNASYLDLKKKVSQLKQDIEVRTGSIVTDKIIQDFSSTKVLLSAWKDHLKLEDIVFEQKTIKIPLGELHSLLIRLAEKKEFDPIGFCGSDEEKDAAQMLWQHVLTVVQSINDSIVLSQNLINSFKNNLQAEDIGKLEAEVSRLELVKKRYHPNVVGLLSNLVIARNEAKLAEQYKKDERKKLDELMKSMLKEYEQAINLLLTNFGASFSIGGMDANFRGSAPRSEYGLQLRGKSIPLDGKGMSFSNTLSEGDRRTLAFAFFVARTLNNPNLNKCVVVIDDPMCSLDLNRKQHTRLILRKIYSQAKQLIILAHDPYFIRDLRDDLIGKENLSMVQSLQICRAVGGYSDFASFDVDMECESPYFRHHRQLVEFVEGKYDDARSVAKAIRPLLEGYLHRRFPGLVPRDLLFGKVVALIRDSAGSSPLSFAQGLTNELNEINDYAGQFHHDTNPGNADSVTINSGELIAYARRALRVIHKGVA